MFGAWSILLLRRASRTPGGATPGRRAALGVFALSGVVLLCMSGVFHMLAPGGTARAVLQRLDHAAIFALIAGTVTPIEVILFRQGWRRGMLLFIWCFAGVGITLKTLFFEATPETLGTFIYVAMGWCGVVSVFAIARRRGIRMTLPILYGGAAYTAGAAVDLWLSTPLINGVVRAHELFHLAILVGLAFHARFIWSIADLVEDDTPRFAPHADGAGAPGLSSASSAPAASGP